jgi:hypothetical protein
MTTSALGLIWPSVQFAPYTIYGGALCHAIAGTSGGVINLQGCAITISNAVTFSTAFAYADSSALVFAVQATFVNPTNVTGPKFLCTNGGYIDTAGGISFLPGSVAGTNVNGYYT